MLLLASRGMVTAALAVSRMRPALTWRALDGDLVAGEVSARLRPDNRWFLYFDTWRADAYPPLADAVARDLGRDLYVTLEDAEYDALDACAQAGFAVHRRESYYRIPADRAVAGLAGAVLPAGLDVLSAAEADITRLRLLDDALRQDVPGSDGLAMGCRTVPCRDVQPVLRSRHLPRRGRPGQRRVRRAGANLAQPRGPAPRPDRDARAVPAAWGRQGPARPGVRRARRPRRYEPSRRGRRHEPRVCLIANRTRRTALRRQRGADQAAAGPGGTQRARRAPTVSRSLGPRRSVLMGPLADAAERVPPTRPRVARRRIVARGPIRTCLYGGDSGPPPAATRRVSGHVRHPPGVQG